MKSLHQIGRNVLYGEGHSWLRAFLFWPLLVASVGTLAVMKVRNLLFDRGWRPVTTLDAAVVSVGNITVGGTGKTPWIVLLARGLRDRGHRVAVLSRGYKAEGEGRCAVVADGETIRMDPAQAGDEPSLIARACPGVAVVLGSKRAESGRLAIERFGADVLLLDDGFQHRFLARDVDIVNFNTRYGMGTGALLPAGILREPPSVLSRADAVVVHGDGQRRELLPEYVRAHFPRTKVFCSRLVYRGLVGIRTGERIAPEAIEGRNVLAFCGIAIPETMFEQLERLGPARLDTKPYPDHFAFDSAEIEGLCRLAREKGVDYIVTSEKDAMKIDPRWISEPGDVFFLEAEIEVEGGEEPLFEWLETTLAKSKADRRSSSTGTGSSPSSGVI